METERWRDELLTVIARQHLHLQTLEPRGDDSRTFRPRDFHNLAVWDVKAALAAAFIAGRQYERSLAATPRQPSPA